MLNHVIPEPTRRSTRRCLAAWRRPRRVFTFVAVLAAVTVGRAQEPSAVDLLTRATSYVEMLHTQLNGMVAEERRARVALEERVRVLEGRARERGGRLERIEGAVARLERVRRVLGDE